jgi:Ca2+-binding EF-hand superfamily protein
MMSRLSRSTWSRLEELFRKMDIDGSNAITRGKANSFFEGVAFGKISCDAMFKEVDVDGSGVVTTEEFLRFWLQVRSSGYSDAQILEEVEELLEGGAWVDWKDNRDTTSAEVKFPKRPLFCRLSQKAWKKCEELFRLMDQERTMVITQNNALSFFKGSFAKMSCDAMFNEIDENQHGVITAAEWMKFWTQVKAAGYKEATIIEEIDLIMDGGSWVDWKDNRSPC